MLKLLLSVLVSLFLVAEPVSAAGAGAQAASSKQKRQVVKKQAARKAVAKAGRQGTRKEAATSVALEDRPRLVRRVVTVRGKRRVTYQTIRRTAPALLAIPAARTAGDMAGLNQTVSRFPWDGYQG